MQSINHRRDEGNKHQIGHREGDRHQPRREKDGPKQFCLDPAAVSGKVDGFPVRHHEGRRHHSLIPGKNKIGR